MKVGQYEIRDKLGVGTVSETFLASGSGNTTVVIKKLRVDLARDAGIAQRFLDASNLTGKIRNPRFLATVRMQTKIGDDAYLVREHVEGKSLEQLRQQGELGSVNARQLAFDLCDALRSLQLRDIVHGGIHPGNIVVQADGHLRVMDFATSRAALTGQIERDYLLSPLRYLAPEQLRGQKADAKSDLYSAALIVFLLIEKRDRVDGDSFTAIKDRIVGGVTMPHALLAPGCHRDAAQRFKTADEMRAALKVYFDARDAGTLDAPPVVTQTPAADVAGASPPVVTPPPAPPVLPGSLQAMIDIRTGVDLLNLNHGQPWRLERTRLAEQWPIRFTNGGPGELRMTLRCLGEGVRLSPAERFLVKPGQSRYVIVNLEAAGSDFVRLDAAWEGQKPSQRVQIRIYRPAT